MVYVCNFCVPVTVLGVLTSICSAKLPHTAVRMSQEEENRPYGTRAGQPLPAASPVNAFPLPVGPPGFYSNQPFCLECFSPLLKLTPKKLQNSTKAHVPLGRPRLRVTY